MRASHYSRGVTLRVVKLWVLPDCFLAEMIEQRLVLLFCGEKQATAGKIPAVATGSIYLAVFAVSGRVGVVKNG